MSGRKRTSKPKQMPRQIQSETPRRTKAHYVKCPECINSATQHQPAAGPSLGAHLSAPARACPAASSAGRRSKLAPGLGISLYAMEQRGWPGGSTTCRQARASGHQHACTSSKTTHRAGREHAGWAARRHLAALILHAPAGQPTRWHAALIRPQVAYSRQWPGSTTSCRRVVRGTGAQAPLRGLWTCRRGKGWESKHTLEAILHNK